MSCFKMDLIASKIESITTKVELNRGKMESIRGKAILRIIKLVIITKGSNSHLYSKGTVKPYNFCSVLITMSSKSKI